MSLSIEKELYEKARHFLAERAQLRKPEVTDIFERKLYISPRDIITDFSKKTPLASFNPGAVIVGDELWVFPRLIFDYYNYTSSIGFFKIPLASMLEGSVARPLKAKVVLWPKYLWEFRGCEDPRIHRYSDRLLVLYTGYGYHLKGDSYERGSVQGLTSLDDKLEPGERKYFVIKEGDEVFLPEWMKDCAFIEISGNKAFMLARPTVKRVVKEIDVCWRGLAELDTPSLLAETMEPVLTYEDWEFKVGWSTNTVKLSENEYLVGWHGVLKEDYSYRNGLAIVDREGDLLAISNYLLAPKGLNEEYGDRPLVVFGDGLALYKEYLIWVGGLSDYAIGIFTVELEKALERLKWIKG